MRSAAILVLLALAGAPPSFGQRRIDAYDETFTKYSKRFFGPAFDWRLFKAQSMTESNLDASARSGVGARGLMQLMPSTFQGIQSRNPEFQSIDDPDWNIGAGIYYDRQLWRQWRGGVAPDHHKEFMFGSYNAGRATLLRAQKVASERTLDPRLWPSIESVAPDVPRWRHRETLEYVRRIRANLGRMDQRGRVGSR